MNSAALQSFVGTNSKLNTCMSVEHVVYQVLDVSSFDDIFMAPFRMQFFDKTDAACQLTDLFL